MWLGFNFAAIVIEPIAVQILITKAIIRGTVGFYPMIQGGQLPSPLS